MKQAAFWANDPVAAPARQPAAPAQFWANDPVAAASTPPRRAPTGGGRQPAPAAAPPVVDEYATPMIRDVQRTAEGTTYVLRPLAPEDTDESLTASGRYFNPTTNTWEFPRGLEDVDVQGGVERLPMQGDAPATGLQAVANVLSRAPGVQELAENPLVSTIAGAFRGEGRVREGARRLLGQGVRMLPFGEQVGQGLIDEAARNNAILDALNMPFREANTGFNQMGQFGAEMAVTAPVGGLLGRGIGLAGQGVGQFAPRVGQGLEALGRSTAAAGFTPSAVGRPAAGMAPAAGERLLNLGTRGAGGAIAGGTQAALINEEDAQAGAAIGALLPTVAARPAKFVASRLMDGYQALAGELGATRAAAIVRQSLGVDYDAALAALRNAAPDVTAQQALVDAGVEPSVFMGVGAEVRGAAPDAYLAIEAAQQAAMEAPINRLAGGPNLTAAQMTQRAEKQALRAATVPEGEAALARAGATGRLDVDAIANQLMARADVPGVRANPEQVQALGNVAQQLRAMADLGGGVIEPADLYEIRQRFITSEVNRLLNTSGTTSPSALRAQQAQITANIAPLIDDAIEAAGGTGWRQYLADYASGMRGVERQQMMGVAGRQLRQNPNTFANLVEGDAPDVVANVFNRNDTLANLMNPTGVGPSGMDALRSAAGQIRRNQRIDVLAGEGRGAAQELIRQSRDQGPIRGMATLVSGVFRPGTTAAMQVGSALLDAQISPQVRTALAQAYQSGANMTELLAMTPLADRAQVQRNLMNPAFWAHLQSGAVNAMINEDDVVISQAVDEQGNAMRPR